jgi:uncharacterized protein (UPF0297 family)
MKNRKMTRKEAKSILRQIYNILDAKECLIKIGYSKKYYGFYDLSGKRETIYINPWSELVITLIHECAHARNFGVNDNDEDEVSKFEKDVYDRLTENEIKELAQKIMLGRMITEEYFKKIPASVIKCTGKKGAWYGKK